MIRAWPCVVVVALVLSGCATSPEVDVEENGEEPSLEDLGDALNQFMFQQDCTSHGMIMPFIGATFPMEPPPEWPPTAVEAVLPQGVIWLLAECKSMSWGPFAGRPILWALEAHNHFQSPEACRVGGMTSEFLLSIYFSDPEVTAYAIEQWNLPAVTADIEWSNGSLPGERTWTVTVGSDTTSISVRHVESEPRPGFGGSVEFFWPDGEGVSYARFLQTGGTTPTQAPVAIHAVGDMAPPTATHAAGVEEYFGTASQDDGSTIDWRFGHFEDWECSRKSDGNETEEQRFNHASDWLHG